MYHFDLYLYKASDHYVTFTMWKSDVVYIVDCCLLVALVLLFANKSQRIKSSFEIMCKPVNHTANMILILTQTADTICCQSFWAAFFLHKQKSSKPCLTWEPTFVDNPAVNQHYSTNVCIVLSLTESISQLHRSNSRLRICIIYNQHIWSYTNVCPKVSLLYTMWQQSQKSVHAGEKLWREHIWPFLHMAIICFHLNHSSCISSASSNLMFSTKDTQVHFTPKANSKQPLGLFDCCKHTKCDTTGSASSDWIFSFLCKQKTLCLKTKEHISFY